MGSEFASFLAQLVYTQYTERREEKRRGEGEGEGDRDRVWFRLRLEKERKGKENKMRGK